MVWRAVVMVNQKEKADSKQKEDRSSGSRMALASLLAEQSHHPGDEGRAGVLGYQEGSHRST